VNLSSHINKLFPIVILLITQPLIIKLITVVSKYIPVVYFKLLHSQAYTCLA